jgi:regulator of chromosome condensation
MKIPELKKIVHLAAGGNHMLALDQKGNVFAWGSGQQNQLGRRVVERTRFGALVPREFGLPKNKIEKIASGAYHSFAIDKAGKVYAWGLNNFCETAVSDGAGEDNAIIPNPTVVTEFSQYRIKQIVGGAHHSLACTEDGKLLVWGRADASQCGVDLDTVPKESFIYDDNNNPRIIKTPTIIPSKSSFRLITETTNAIQIFRLIPLPPALISLLLLT